MNRAALIALPVTLAAFLGGFQHGNSSANQAYSPAG